MAPSAFAASVQPHTTSGAAVVAAGAPAVSAGATNQAGANLAITLPNKFVSGDTITYQVAPHTNANCSLPNDTVGFASVPTVKVTGPTASGGGAGSTSDTAPSLSASISTASGESACSAANVKDLLTISIGNTATGTSTDSYTVNVSGISYNVGSKADLGTLSVNPNGTGATTTAGNGATGASNATVSTSPVVTANTPAVGVATNSTAAGISNVVITENANGTPVPAGYVCVTLTGGTFNPKDTPTASVSGGGTAAVDNTKTAVTNSNASVVFDIKTASSSGQAATYTLSGLTVDASTTTGPVTATVTDTQTATCGATAPPQLASGLRAYYVVNTTRTAGTDAPGTAAAQFEAAFPGYKTGSGCPTSAVVARYDEFPDALSGSTVAGVLNTGILLTSTSTLSTETANALKLEGISTVYLMGGPLAVSDAVMSQIQALPVYACGGTSPSTTQKINVIRIQGQDRYGTSQAADQFALAKGGALTGKNLSAAYGKYNDTTGSASPSGQTGENAALATALVTTGQNFRDAVSASVLSASANFPMILTTATSLSPEAASTLTSDHIQQVIVLGGPLAVSDSVVNQIEGMGIYVLRVAGQDGTDTAQQLAQFELATAADAGMGWAPDNGTSNNVALSRGNDFPDALAGSAYARYNSGSAKPEPILLTETPDSIGTYTTSFLNTGGSNPGIDGLAAPTGSVDQVDVFGGTLAISTATQQAALNAISEG